MLNFRAGQDCSIWKQREAEGCKSHAGLQGQSWSTQAILVRATPRTAAVARGRDALFPEHTPPGCSAGTRVVPRSGNANVLS
jgi:hypothetical protein